MRASKAAIAALNAYNARIPFNAWMGVEVLSATENTVELRAPWRVEFGGAPGMTHGGILASLVDCAAFMVLMVAKGTGGPTIDMRIDYHRSTVNGTLSISSRLLRAGATISTAEVVIKDAEDRLVATGRCVFLSNPRKPRTETQA